MNNLPYILFFNEDDLGKIVRNAWIEWAKEQPNPKPSWLVPYEELSQPDKDADIRIGKAVVEQCNKCIPTILKNYKSK
jgi:hypothetical protein